MCPTNSTWSGSRFPCKMKRWKTKRLWFASKGCWQKQLLLVLSGDRFICLSGFGLPCSTAELHPPTELLSLSGIFRSSPEPKWMGPLANMKHIWPWHGPCYSKVPINSMEKKRETNKHVLLASQSLQVFFSHSFNHFSRWDFLLEIYNFPLLNPQT